MADPYTTLGIARGASEAEIKKSYRKLAKELHPDKHPGDPAASDRFSRVTAAYDLLSDKDKRARFDRGEIDGDGNPAAPFGYGGGGARGPAGGFQSGGGDFGDIFEGLFGGRAGGRGGFGGNPFGQPPAKGANVAYRLAVGFEDAAALRPQRITLRDGKTIDVKLPAGVETGTQMRLAGKGDAGAGGAGDAIITIEIGSHPFYRRDGDAVRLDLPVALSEAVLGGPVKVPTVDGAVMLNVPPGSSSGKVLRLRERGFTGKAGSRGDQLVTLMIEVPENDADLKNWAKTAVPGNPRAKLGV
jgi:DnaJ-class molecular chaperone